ncbi:unnamed protein product [Cochlearia groenlandica]
MTSSYTTISSSYAPSFLISAASAPRANNFNREETTRMMVQQPNFVAPPPPIPIKKRRNYNDQDVEVVALTPNEITTPNRYICEVCNKGFPRDQNLQLHMRGHNRAWKLKTKSNKEVKRKVYVCPVVTCVHHNPSRALGDLTGIKKHYYRKHLEKIWNCEKCPKRYAVQSDLKAHSKICGTKEYECDHCGTIFARRDHYNSNKALCETLTQEPAKNPTVSFTAMVQAAIRNGDRHGFYEGSQVGFSQNHNGNIPNSNFTPPAAGYNLNCPFSNKFEDLVPHSTNPNQGILAYNNQSLMNQHGDDIINNNKFNLSYQTTSVPSLYTNVVDNKEPSGFLKGFPSSGVVNDYGNNDTESFQGLANNQSRPGGSIFDPCFGSNFSMGESNRSTFDFLGGNGRFMSNSSDRGGGGGRGGTPFGQE